jgi:hypothetical protein
VVFFFVVVVVVVVFGKTRVNENIVLVLSFKFI